MKPSSLATLLLFHTSTALNVNRHQSITRRNAFTKTTNAILFITSTQPSHATSTIPQQQQEESSSSPSSLLSIIPKMPFGAPATNVTISPELSHRIESETSHLETKFNMTNLALSSVTSTQQKQRRFTGTWRLIYSNAPEIINLAYKLPFGFVLGPTYQPINITTLQFENLSIVSNRFSKKKKNNQLQIRVLGDIAIAQRGLSSVNAVGIPNDMGNRININFTCIAFQLDELFGRRFDPPIKKILIPKLSPDAVQPANDVSYLDDKMRVVRGGDGSLFIFVREEIGDDEIRMLTLDERERLCFGDDDDDDGNGIFSSLDGDDGASAVGVGSVRNSPELKFLFND